MISASLRNYFHVFCKFICYYSQLFILFFRSETVRGVGLPGDDVTKSWMHVSEPRDQIPCTRSVLCKNVCGREAQFWIFSLMTKVARPVLPSWLKYKNIHKNATIWGSITDFDNFVYTFVETTSQFTHVLLSLLTCGLVNWNWIMSCCNWPLILQS